MSVRIAIIVLACAVMRLACSGSRSRSDIDSFISIDEELALSKALVEQTASQLRILDRPLANEFFNGLALEIGAVSDWNGLDYSVHIVDEEDVNHFSLPGGQIYLFRGLIDVCETAGEIAAVIAHEIAHVSHRDGIERLARKYGFAFAAQELIGNNPQIPYQIVSQLYSEGTLLDYPRSAEYRADARAIGYLVKANFDPRSLLELLERFRVMEDERPDLMALLRTTHPRAMHRFNKARKVLFRTSRPEDLIRDLKIYNKIKQELKP